MCRFESKNSPGYRLVVAALIRYAAEASSTVRPRWVNTKRILQEMRANEALELLQ